MTGSWLELGHEHVWSLSSLHDGRSERILAISIDKVKPIARRVLESAFRILKRQLKILISGYFFPAQYYSHSLIDMRSIVTILIHCTIKMINFGIRQDISG